jgi:hypothetical protein
LHTQNPEFSSTNLRFTPESGKELRQCGEQVRQHLVFGPKVEYALSRGFGEHCQVERAIGGNCTTSSAQVATSAQCHTLDGTRNRVGTCSEKGYKMSYDNRFQSEDLENAPLSNLMNIMITRE